MILIRNREQQIYNIAIIIFLVCALFTLNISVYAKDDKRDLVVDYSKFDQKTVSRAADTFFNSALESKEPEERLQNLKNSAAQYYILSNIDKSDIFSYIRLARIYDMQKNDSYAKAYFYSALSINPKNTEANFYFAEFYYTREQYKKALIYYQKALKYGRDSDADMLKKIGIIYQRLGDLPRAVMYYQKSLELNPDDKELVTKTQQSQKIKEEYDKSGYYKRRLRY